MFRRSTTIVVVVVLGWAAAIGASSAADASRADTPWGQRLVAEVAVPDAVVQRYATHKRSAPDPREAQIINALLADSVDWVGPAVTIDAARNPYTTVIIVRGRALADGDVSSMWRAGWELEERTGDSGQRLTAVPGVARNNAKADEPLVLSAAAAPLSFRDDGAPPLLVQFAWAKNLAVDDVTIQVWSGVGEPGWRDWLLAGRPVLVGLVMIGLLWWWRWR